MTLAALAAPALRQLPAAAPLADLAQAWLYAKKAEKDANARRLDIETEILKQTRHMAVDEGTATANTDGYVIKIGFSMTRSIDEAALAARVSQELPEDTLRRLFIYAPKLDMRELRHLQEHEPRLYTIAAQCITTKPAKPSIAITESQS